MGRVVPLRYLLGPPKAAPRLFAGGVLDGPQSLESRPGLLDPLDGTDVVKLTIVGNETRRCMDCGARIRNVAPDVTACIWCGGRLETPKAAWL